MPEPVPDNPSDAALPVVVEDTPVVQAADKSAMSAPDEETVTRVIIRRRASSGWAISVVFLAAIAAATFLAYNFFYRLPSQVVETGGQTVTETVEKIVAVPHRLAEAFRPNVNVQTIISNSVGAVKSGGKLVVMTASVDAEVGKTSEKKILWDLLELGDTTVRIRVRENKVQYYIPLEQFGESNMEYEPDSRCLVISLPEPILDTEVVEVQSNPEMIDVQTEVGWGRLSMFSGSFLVEEAKKELRGAVLQAGVNPLLQERAKRDAEAAISQLAAELVSSLREDVALSVRFQ